jgi:hypothetical protein
MRTGFSVSLLIFAAALSAQTLKVEISANPAGAGSSQVNWSITPEGQPLLSWIDPLKDGSFALRYSTRDGSRWAEPRTVADHRHFFHHPAELPEVISMNGGGLLAHWI